MRFSYACDWEHHEAVINRTARRCEQYACTVPVLQRLRFLADSQPLECLPVSDSPSLALDLGPLSVTSASVSSDE